MTAPQRHYDRVTEAWRLLLGDEFHYGVFTRGSTDLAAASAELTRLMVEAADLGRDTEVLDVGCGTGAQACHLAAAVGARVVGITTSEVGVDAARARAAAAGVEDRVRFEQRDGMANGFPDASFDRAWVLESSHLMRKRDRLVGECARVLRPGGRIALCDIVQQRDMPFEEVRRLREPLALLRDVFGDARMEPLARYAELAEANGLSVERTVDLTDATRPTFAAWRDNAHRHRAEVVELLGEGEWRNFVDATAVMEEMWDSGRLGYGLMAAVKPA